MIALFPIATMGANSKTIDELESIQVNGTKQWLLYRGRSASLPIVLFVHGGPGSPLMLFSRAYDDVFTKDFIVVHWDQRGSGKSDDPHVSAKTFTLRQVVSDGLVVVEHIRKKFHRSKILLVGHSWGTMVASHMAKQKPQDFIAYISVGTVADDAAGDKMMYQFLSKAVQRWGNKKDQADLKALGHPPWTDFDHAAIRSRLGDKFGAAFHKLKPADIKRAMNQNKEYSQQELENMNMAQKNIFNQISPFLSRYKAIDEIPRLDVPVIFVQGRYDMTTPTSLAKLYFQHLEAPEGKKWIEFKDSGHFPMYEEPRQFLKVLQESANSTSETHP